jgi:hypothetical protein
MREGRDWMEGVGWIEKKRSVVELWEGIWVWRSWVRRKLGVGGEECRINGWRELKMEGF